MKKFVLAAVALALSACASIHEGKLAEPVSGDGHRELNISGTELNNQLAEPFALLAFTFENTSDDWVRIARVDVLIDEEAAKTVSVVIGQDLEDWAQAQQAKESLDNYNREMTQLGLASLGAVAAVGGAASGNKGMAYTGVGVMAGVSAVQTADIISMKRGRATNPNYVPDQHIYRPFSVPGRLFVRKWILLNKKVSQRINTLPLEITYVDGKKEVRNAVIKLPVR